MILHSKFGLGEIANFKNRAGADELVEVVQIIFAYDGNAYYTCRMTTGRFEQFAEHELIGDPDIDRLTGYLDDAEKDD